MAGFDFGQIGGIIGDYMDADEIDVYRATLIELPDGSFAPSDPNTPFYSGIKVHISFSDVDNPDPVAVGAVPIIHALRINCAVGIDLQNADRIVARKLAFDGTVLETYEGVIGAPVVNQSRQEATMSVRQGV